MQKMISCVAIVVMVLMVTVASGAENQAPGASVSFGLENVQWIF